jgi:hypothetical protein
MLGNFAFTLYELFGYLVPGCVALIGIVITYWSLFVPKVPLNFTTYRPGSVTWIAVAFFAYLLGHALQGLTNPLWKQIEYEALFPTGKSDAWLGRRAVELAAKIAAASADEFAPIDEQQRIDKRLAVDEAKKINGNRARWTFRVLDGYNLQFAKPGDREIFVYREGFYRATSVSLFILVLALLLRASIPGASVTFAWGVFYISITQLLLTALLLCAVARIFVSRFRRFADYRVTHTVLSVLVLDKLPPKS